MFKYIGLVLWSIVCFFGSVFSSVLKNWGKSLKNRLIKLLTKVLPYVIVGIILVHVSEDPIARQLMMQYAILIGLVYFIYKWIKKILKF